MRVKIIRKEFSGVEFCPEMRVLHLGGQSSANVERLYFELPEEWQGKSVTLHIQQQDGTLPAPILLDEEHSAAVGKAFTAAKCGSWMLLALGEDGYRALTRPTKYDCYETLATDGDAEISPTQYETFVAQVLAYANSAQNSAKEARNSAAAANRDAAIAQMAQNTAQTAAARAETAQGAAESGAKRAEDAAARAELTAPADGAVRSVNGKGGVVTLTADDLGAVPDGSGAYVKNVALNGQTLTLTLGSGKQTSYTIPTATAERLGLVKVGENLSVEEDGTLNGVEGGYSKDEIDSKLQRLERMMNMDGKLVFSGAGVCTGGTTTMAIPSTVDYAEIVSAIPAIGRSGAGWATTSGYKATTSNAIGTASDFGHAKVVRGCSAAVPITSLTMLSNGKLDGYNYANAKIENTSVSMVSVAFASDGTLSVSGGSSGSQFVVYGYQYL